MFQLLDSEHKIGSKTSRKKGLPKRTRREESRTEGRPAVAQSYS